jgi:hypothetical protein
LPQAPQFVSLVVRFVSQPSVCLLLLQSANPAVHTPLQTPAPQVRVAMLFAEQTAPHAPQLFGSVLRLTSQPSVSLLSLQSANPALHPPLHLKLLQLGVEMWFAEQVLPHPPQFDASVATLVSHPSFALPLQSAVPNEHITAQCHR